MDINDKKIIITGAASGIGLLTAEKLIAEGAVVGILDINDTKFNYLTEKYKDKIFCNACDVSNFQQVTDSIEAFYKLYNQIDILINNAAFIYNSPLINIFAGYKKHDIDMWHKVINTDLNSFFYTTANVVEKMLKSRTNGLVLNISSICSSGNAGQGAYSAAKAGTEAMTKAWAKELSSFGIRFASLAPGYTETETTIQSISESISKDIKNKTPLKRFAKVDEIVDGILFIIRNDFFNGKVLQIDGGLVI